MIEDGRRKEEEKSPSSTSAQVADVSPVRWQQNYLTLR
jgi:hypothetical protein